jgi:pentatricopeptide repeat protein
LYEVQLFNTNNVTHNILRDVHLILRDIHGALELHGEMVWNGFAINIFTDNGLLDALCKHGNMREVEALLNEITKRGLDLDEVVYNTLVDENYRIVNIDEALQLHKGMGKRGTHAYCHYL